MNKLFVLCVLLGYVESHDLKRIPNKACINHYRDGDFIIGGLFPIRYVVYPVICANEGRNLSPHGLRNAEAMVFAVEYINSLPDILPNVTLGFDIRDDCRSEFITLFQANTLSTNTGAEEFTHVCGRPPNGNVSEQTKQVIGIVGTGENPSTIVAAHVGSVTQVPVVSWSAGGDELHDKQRFPYFARTVPQDSGQVGGLVDLLLYYNWSYVGVLYSRDNEGLFNSQTFKSQAEPNICIAYFEPVSLATSDADMNDILDKIRDYNKATVLVMLIFDNQIALRVFRALNESGLAGKVTIICGTSCGFGLVRRGLGNVTYAALFIRDSQPDVPQFDVFYNAQNPKTMQVSPWFQEYWEDANGTVPDPNMGGSSVIKATAVIAYALDALLNHTCVDSSQCVTPSRIDTSLLMDYIKNVSFTTITGGTFKFQSDGEAISEYTFRNMQIDDGKFMQVDVGKWNGQNETGNRIQLKTDEIHFKSGVGQIPKSVCREDCPVGSYPVPLERKCCWGCRKCPLNAIVMDSDCLECAITHWPDDTRTECLVIVPTIISWSDPIIIAITAVASIGLLLSGLVVLGLVLFINHALIKSTSRELSGINIFGIIVTYLAVFVFLAKPSKIVCPVMESVLALSFTITYAPTMLKVNRIYRIFKSGRKSVKRPRWVGPRPQVVMCLMLVLIQVSGINSHLYLTFQHVQFVSHIT